MHRPDLLNSDIGSVTNRLKFKQVRSKASIDNSWNNDMLLKGPPMQTILMVPEERLPGEVHLGRPKARVCIWKAQKSHLKHLSWQLAGFSLLTFANLLIGLWVWNDANTAIAYILLQHWPLCRTTTRTRTTWVSTPATTSWPALSSSHSPRSEWERMPFMITKMKKALIGGMLWLWTVTFKVATMTGNYGLSGTSCEGKTIAPRSPLPSHNAMRRLKSPPHSS